jgi:3-hydroxyacyl-[acyl-carrier-protein] dehydratase
MRYLLIDQITEWKSPECIKGRKNVAMTEDYLEYHFPKNPIMPGSLLLEALGQLAGWYEAKSSEFRNWVLIHKVIKCSFYGFVYPGDQVDLELQCLAVDDSTTRAYKGIGRIREKKKIAAEFEGRLFHLSDLDDIEDRKRMFLSLTRELRVS